MKKTISTVLLLSLLSAALAACQLASKTTIIGEQDAGKTITLSQGDTLVVELEGNPTTGYSWIPAQQDPALLVQMGDVEVTPQSSAVGAPGMVVLKFKADTRGETLFRLDYKRPWETGVAPEMTFQVPVIVQ